ncbi:MAG: hypothetical protein DYG89_03760 [Caldilinea sp. CFX5]|nr:hypothetical protein [Caldilinea sp. CFX5]
MTDAVGPIFAGGFQHFPAGGYELLYLPDLHNDELQREGKAPVYYWMPNYVRLARQQGDTGDFKFHLLHFVGVQSSDANVGVQGTRETAGGLVSFSTTAAPPAAVLQQSQNELLNAFRGNDDRFWGWRTSVAPMFRPMPIVANNTTLTNLSPLANGSTPAPAAPTGPSRARNGSRPRLFQSTPHPRFMPSPRTVPLTRDGATTSNLDPWYANLQGQGPGAIDLFAEQAYAGLVGSLPAALLWSSFHGAYSGIVVRQDLRMKFWAPLVTITIHGDWDRIFDHFSAAASGHYLWASVDIKVELNNLRINGGIEVNIEVDPTIPGADKLSEDIDKKTDLIYNKFMEAAQKVIFEPPQPQVQAAQADSGSGLWGVAFALKYRRDETHLTLDYRERREIAYLQDQTISGTLEGFYNEIKADPSAEKKYFTTLYLDDWDRKVTRIVKPVVNWPDPAQKWEGEPVAFLSCQIGYPATTGDIQWSGHIFQSTDAPDAQFTPAMAKKNAADVANPPAGWTPDKTFVKRQIHFAEPPDETQYPFVRMFVEKNVVDLDPGDYGSLVDDINLEVRADSAGKLDVSPITLGVDLDNAKQMVEVSFQCLGKTDAGQDRNITKFTWTFADQYEPRHWAIYTGQLDFVPRYRYQVRVVVKGSLFTKGMEWTGQWEEVAGNGPLIVHVPTPDDPGVTTRAMPIGVGQPVGQPTPAPVTANGGRPPVSAPPPARVAPSVSSSLTVGGWNIQPSGGSAVASPPPAVPARSRAQVESERSEPVFSGWHTAEPAGMTDGR